jgi:hypothetical protein
MAATERRSGAGANVKKLQNRQKPRVVVRYTGHASEGANFMAVVEREQETRERQPERAIFVAEDGRRARHLRRVAFAATAVACLWAVGLGIGMLGFGNLPGVSLVKEKVEGIAGIGGGPTDPPRAERNDVAPAIRRSRPVEAREVASTSKSAVLRPHARPAARPAVSRRGSRPPTRAAPPPAAQQPANPAQRTRGWARRGQLAPPGQTRRVTPPPPPGTRGQRRGQTLPTTPPPVPPGQTKKAQTLPPPPPPPPPKKA